MKLRIDAPRILDMDIENRPLTYLGGDWTTAEITAIAASFGLDEPIDCWLLGRDDPQYILKKFVELYDQADIVTGHYLRKHDLPIINGSLLEYGMPPLGLKMTVDTKLDLKPMKDISRSQESLGAMLGTSQQKVHMTQLDWREANRLERIEAAETRVIADVRQHQELRIKLSQLGMLGSAKAWGAA